MGSRVYRGGKSSVINMDEENLETMNNSLAESLSAKVGQLKNVAFDLDREARDHLPLLDGLSDEMESGTVRLGGSSGRLRSLGRTRGVTERKLTCYVGLFVTLFLIFVYYFLIPMTFN